MFYVNIKACILNVSFTLKLFKGCKENSCRSVKPEHSEYVKYCHKRHWFYGQPRQVSQVFLMRSFMSAGVSLPAEEFFPFSKSLVYAPYFRHFSIAIDMM